MSDTATPGELEPLAPLEPLDAGAGMAGPGSDEATLMVLRSGMPAPAFNPMCRDKTFYKFLFAGVLMVVGCLMPFSANLAVAGYQTISGGLYLIIGIAMVWTWWGAIHNNRSTNASLKWLLFCAIPLIAGIMGMASFDAEAALTAAKAAGYLPQSATTSTWGTVFGDMFTAGRPGAGSIEPAARVSTFWMLLGPGKFFVTLGALYAELGFIGGILGGAKQNKQMKQQKQMAASERKRK